MRVPALILALLAIGSVPASAADGPLVLFIGDSTTQGICTSCPPPPAASPATALAMLRDRFPAASRWRTLRTLALGVGGTTSVDWVRVRPEICNLMADRPIPSGGDIGLTVLSRACAAGTGLAAAAREIAGETPAVVLLVLGANDVMDRVRPEDFVANLRRIAATFAPAPVLIGTPFYSPQPERAGLADLAAAVRDAGLLSGPDFHAVRLPVDRSLVHLTDGGYAAAAGLWLDKLPP